MNELIRISENGKVTARELYDFLGADKSNYARWCKANIESNPYAEENIDFISFVVNDERNPNPATDYELSIDFAKKLCMVSKSERGEQARNYFIEVEKQFAKEKQDLSLLSPELQVLINLELKAKEQEKQIHELRVISTETRQELKGMREVISLNVKNWRINTKGLLNAIARKAGSKEEFAEHIRALRAESYELLDKRLGVNLKRRLTELKKRVALKGIAKSKLDALCYLDTIEADKKLVEGYMAIVKEMAIRYGVRVEDTLLKENFY